MKFENTQVWGFEHALRGMRNPKNSWHLSDSWAMSFDDPDADSHGGYWIGPKDMKLALALTNAGPEHRKFLRQIMISVDITAPLYWWKEFDTYKVATVANSTSTMHKIQSYPITRESFEMDDFVSGLKFPAHSNDEVLWNHDDFIDDLIDYLENLRLEYNATIDALKLPQGDPDKVAELQEHAYVVWKELIRWLPESWLQTRTVTFNYETVRAMCSPGQRRFHKLNEWSGIHAEVKECFISWARTLPYAEQFIFTDEMPKPEKRLIDKIVDALAILGVKAKDEKGNFRLFAYIMDDVAKVYSEAMKEQN